MTPETPHDRLDSIRQIIKTMRGRYPYAEVVFDDSLPVRHNAIVIADHLDFLLSELSRLSEENRDLRGKVGQAREALSSWKRECELTEEAAPIIGRFKPEMYEMTLQALALLNQ